VRVGSTFPTDLIDDAARVGIKSRLTEAIREDLCATATASSGGSAVKNFMMRFVGLVMVELDSNLLYSDADRKPCGCLSL
jgi:hypothetical protein